MWTALTSLLDLSYLARRRARAGGTRVPRVSSENERGTDVAVCARMTNTLRFSTFFAMALLVLSTALPASAEDPPAPARHPSSYKQSISVTFALTPLYLGDGTAYYDGGGDSPLVSNSPLLLGLAGEYMYRFGILRLGGGLRFSHTSDKRWDNWNAFVDELGLTTHLALGGTTRGGVDIAATLGLGGGIASMAGNSVFPLCFGGFAELLGSVAIPVTPKEDFYLRTGLNMGFYTGDNTQEGDSMPRPTAYFFRGYVPLEIGVRSRF